MSIDSRHTEELHVQTRRKCQVIDITPQVAAAVHTLGVAEGLCHVYVVHTTAAITINENADPNVGEDLLTALGRLVPEGGWKHDRIDNNAAAHIKSSLLGPSETIPVHHGQLCLGTWQAVMLVEFDGPRTRRLLVSVLTER
jgi:secondary thiamine-phosphate synthase enzyme